MHDYHRLDSTQINTTSVYHPGRKDSSCMPTSSPGSVFPPLGFFPTTAAWTPSSASVHFSSAAYRCFSRLWLVTKSGLNQRAGEKSLLSVKLQSHGHLVNASLNFSFENQPDQQFLNFIFVYVQLLFDHELLDSELIVIAHSPEQGRTTLAGCKA
jgi:hypothetical protein